MAMRKTLMLALGVCLATILDVRAEVIHIPVGQQAPEKNGFTTPNSRDERRSSTGTLRTAVEQSGAGRRPADFNLALSPLHGLLGIGDRDS